MKSRVVRLYGKEDLRLEEIELPAIREDEILAKVVSDSVCMSTYKAFLQGGAHKRVPYNVAENPVIIGHEFCGEIVEVGAKWQDQFKPGDKFSIQPALHYEGYKGQLDDPTFCATGYSYSYGGGDATYIIIPADAMLTDSLLPYSGEAFYYGSLAEPMSCIVSTFHAMYHTVPGEYRHEMGIREGGNMAILAGVGPMGLGAIDYAIHNERKPGLLVVTDIDEDRLKRAATIMSVDEAAKNGVKLVYVNARDAAAAEASIMDLTGGAGFDDVLIFAPVKSVAEMGGRILDKDGCLNFFAGPAQAPFIADFDFYRVHYASTHVVGTSGGMPCDMVESLAMMSDGRLNTSAMVTHIGGLNAVIDTVANLPNIKGGKKLIYTHIDMPLTAIDDFAKLGETDPFYAKLAEICARHNGLWSPEAERFLLAEKA